MVRGRLKRSPGSHGVLCLAATRKPPAFQPALFCPSPSPQGGVPEQVLRGRWLQVLPLLLQASPGRGR